MGLWRLGGGVRRVGCVLWVGEWLGGGGVFVGAVNTGGNNRLWKLQLASG